MRSRRASAVEVAKGHERQTYTRGLLVWLASALQELLQSIEKDLPEVVVARIEREVTLSAVYDETVLVAFWVIALVGVHIEVDPLLDGELAYALNTEDVLKSLREFELPWP